MNKFVIDQSHGQLNGSASSADVTVSGTTSTEITSSLFDRKEILIDNSSGGTIYLGGVNVTRFDGYPLEDNGKLSLTLGRAKLYAVTDSATVSGVRVLEIS